MPNGPSENTTRVHRPRQTGRGSECQAEQVQLHSAPSRRGTREDQSRPDRTSSNESEMRRSRLQMSVSQISYSSTRKYRAIQFFAKRNRWLSKGEMGPFSKSKFLSDSVQLRNRHARGPKPTYRGQELQHRDAKISKTESRRGVTPQTPSTSEKGPKCPSKKQRSTMSRMKRSSNGRRSFETGGATGPQAVPIKCAKEAPPKIRDSSGWQPPAGSRVPRTRRGVIVIPLTSFLPTAQPPATLS